MYTTNETLQSLWRYMDIDRGAERAGPWNAFLAMARGEIKGDFTPEVLAAVVSKVDSRAVGEYVTPPMISHFMADLAKIVRPGSVLDPTCGTGVMLHEVISAINPVVAKGYDINDEGCEIARSLLAGKAVIEQGNALTLLDDSPEKYDLIIADLPLGVRIDTGQLPTSIKEFSLRDLGQSIVAIACKKIKHGGALSVVLPPSALNYEPFIKNIHAAGCRIRASLHVPSGTRLNTRISTEIVVVDHGPQKEIFVGELSENPEHRKRLLENFSRHKSDKHPGLGRTVQLNRYLGFGALKAEHLLRQKLRQTSLKSTPFVSLVKEERRIDRESLNHESYELPVNTLLLPQSGIRFATDISKIPKIDRTCTCIVLDESKVHVTYLMHWFEGELGKLALQASGASDITGISRISKNALSRLICYLHPENEQRNVLEALRHIESLRNEAQEIEAQIWEGYCSGEEILQRAKTINQEDRYEDWLATLPYPLASILWRHRVSGEDPRIRLGVLLHFFEALGEFLAIVHLSAISNHSIFWRELHEKLTNVLTKQNLSLERATFGAWKIVVEMLGAHTRGMLENNDDASTVTRLYATTSVPWLKKLCAPEISQVLTSANSIRNTYSGHGGAMGKDQAESLEDDLRGFVEDLRSLWGRGWNQYELLQVDKMTYMDGQFTMECPRVMGANNQFERVSRTTSEPMDSGCLYLFSEGASKGLKLLPLVRVMASPSKVANACYFYNRSENSGHRFVSYHFEQESEIHDYFEDTATALRQLATLPDNLGE